MNIQERLPLLNSKHTTLSSRLESYKNYWPKSLKQTALTMARAGFFYTGVADRVICFCCSLGLKDWDPNDDPFVQHCKWNSSCQYLVMCKGADFVQKVLHAERNTADPERKLCNRHGLHCAEKSCPVCVIADSLRRGASPNYKFEAHRLHSLFEKSDWPYVTPFDLAKSGFYYTGDGDNVRCEFCRLEVRGWEAGDTPDGVHRRCNPNCPFLLNERSAMNIKIGLKHNKSKVSTSATPFDVTDDHMNCSPNISSMKAAASSSSVGNYQVKKIARIPVGTKPYTTLIVFIPVGAMPFNDPLGHLRKYGTSLRIVIGRDPCLLTARDLSIQEWCDPLSPNFATTASRIASYAEFWPRSIGQSPRELAKAGFFYTGNADRVTCFQCDLPLMNWHPEDVPFVRHCIMNPDCQFLKMCKGPNLESLLSWHVNGEEEGREMQGASDSVHLRCTKCRNRLVTKVNLRCGHMTLCSNCTDQICVICYRDIIAVINIANQ